MRYLMSRIKSIVISASIDEALKAHNCQANNNHRIQKGEKRMKVRNGRSWNHYCIECSKKILNIDIEKLNQLIQFLEK